MPMEVTIFDLSGKQLGRQSYTLNAGSNQLTINVSYLSAGMYYLKTFTAEGQQRIMKFIKNDPHCFSKNSHALSITALSE